MAGPSTEWWMFARWSDEYERGTDTYIDEAFLTMAQGNEIPCPCQVCHYRNWHVRSVVKDHIICNGFVPRFERIFRSTIDNDVETGVFEHDPTNLNDGIHELLHDNMRGRITEDAKEFMKLLEEGQEELFLGCKTFTRLSFIICAYIYKCDHKLSNLAFVDLFKLFKEVIPNAKVPRTYNESKKVLKVLGLDYTKIDACPNDCMLYWEEYVGAISCHICGASRWKTKDKAVENTEGKTHMIPAKILRYFPIKKRLQRLYLCGETARYMTWHAKGREKDGMLQHPVDGKSWKDFDYLYPTFADEPRNVRLGLATDGFNPFHT